MNFIDTHTHIDGDEFSADRDSVISRCKAAGAVALFVPGINRQSIDSITQLTEQYPGYCYGMLGLHPEDVKADWSSVLDDMQQHLSDPRWIAIGEVGLDYYWSREFETEQVQALERQVMWACDRQLPLMLHCRKAQQEMVKTLRPYADRLCGGVFHCFTGNEIEARELLAFDDFMLGIGGVLTFKKSHLPETLRQAVPLERIVLETDAPYMAPVPHRGERNESSFIIHIIHKLAEIYDTTPDDVAEITTRTARKLFLKAGSIN